MCPITFFVATTLLGFQFGWEARPEGGVQYIIQLNSDALDALRSGQPIESDIRPELLGDVRSFRIVVGDKALSRRLPAHPAAAPAALPPNPASKPLAEQPTTFVGPASADNPTAPKPVVQNSPAPPTVEKPWLLFWLTVLALFASMGGNIFLGWITWDVRSRYRSLLGQAVA